MHWHVTGGMHWLGGGGGGGESGGRDTPPVGGGVAGRAAQRGSARRAYRKATHHGSASRRMAQQADCRVAMQLGLRNQITGARRLGQVSTRRGTEQGSQCSVVWDCTIKRLGYRPASTSPCASNAREASKPLRLNTLRKVRQPVMPCGTMSARASAQLPCRSSAKKGGRTKCMPVVYAIGGREVGDRQDAGGLVIVSVIQAFVQSQPTYCAPEENRFLACLRGAHLSCSNRA
jgi:hypothetical protein